MRCDFLEYGENIAEKVKSTDGVYDLKDSWSVLEELIQRIMDVLLNNIG